MARRHGNAATCPGCRLLIAKQVVHRGRTVKAVAQDFETSSGTVRKWVRRYVELGVEGLADRSSRPHRSPRQLLKPGSELDGGVFALLHTPPRDSGYNRTSWRLRDLKEALAARGMAASANSIRDVIRRTGYAWKKTRVALTSTDTDYRAKVDALKSTLAGLGERELFFSIDEFGPFAVKTRGGRSLQPAHSARTVPQWQRSRGSLIVMAALELSRNQVTHFFSDRKDSEESIRLIEALRRNHREATRIFLSWDAAPWHSSKRLLDRIRFLNEWAPHESAPEIVLVPLPSNAQFLNVIKSVFSGMARAVIHNSDYADVSDAKAAISRYFDERNEHFVANPRKAGKAIWRSERVLSTFNETNNCKDLRYR